MHRVYKSKEGILDNNFTGKWQIYEFQILEAWNEEIYEKKIIVAKDATHAAANRNPQTLTSALPVQRSNQAELVINLVCD